MAFSLAAQLQLRDSPGGFRLPEHETFKARWRQFRADLGNGLDFQSILSSGDELRRVFLLAALSSEPTLCSPGICSTLDEHIITQLFESLFGKEALAPVSLIFFWMDNPWGYLCEPSSLDAILGGAELLRGATALDQPLAQLARHCHLRASASDSFLSAARLIDDCLLLRSCTRGLVITPSAAAPAISDAISRFVAVATLSLSVRCSVINVYPIEVAFGYRAKDRWFEAFVSDVQRRGGDAIKMLGFDLARGSIQDRDGLWKAFVAKKQFAELVDLAMLDGLQERSASSVQNRYEAFGPIAHCTECYERAASFDLPGNRLLCEPCNWKASVGAKVLQKARKVDGQSFLDEADSLAAIAITCDPFYSVFAEPSSLSTAISAAQRSSNAISMALGEVGMALPRTCLFSRLSASEALLLVRRDDLGRCSALLESVLRRDLKAQGGNGNTEVRLGFSGGEQVVPIRVLVREAVSSAQTGKGKVIRA
ncbi:MAG: hypothetical protein JW759_02160 [Candidatus Coatesbacteria bacterium]|nr:hypothetical protein [Candidatus Coatesbacteria bacterium]